jgi:hypothetical protein
MEVGSDLKEALIGLSKEWNDTSEYFRRCEALHQVIGLPILKTLQSASLVILGSLSKCLEEADEKTIKSLMGEIKTALDALRDAKEQISAGVASSLERLAKQLIADFGPAAVRQTIPGFAQRYNLLREATRDTVPAGGANRQRRQELYTEIERLVRDDNDALVERFMAGESTLLLQRQNYQQQTVEFRSRMRAAVWIGLAIPIAIIVLLVIIGATESGKSMLDALRRVLGTT